MAEVETKKTTKKTTKSTAKPKTAKPKEVEQVVEQPTVEQPQMQFSPEMFAMFQQFMAMQQAQMQPMAEPTETRVRKTSGKTKAVTKAQLRRKYANTDVYLAHVVPGSSTYTSRTGYTYTWEYIGDIQAVPVADVLNMPDVWLHSPWLAIDEEENDEELIDDLVTCLRLESIYEHLYILSDVENSINEVDLTKVKEVLAKTKDSTLVKDMKTIVQDKITKGELTNFHMITDFEKILKCKFKKEND